MGTKQTALITGASGGIGLELAREFAQGGHDLVLVARSEGKLQALATELAKAHGIQATVMTADLAVAGSAATLVKALEGRGLTIDVLVNNAGYGLYGKFVETDTEMELKMIQLNIGSLTHLTKLLLPGMVARKQGRVLNVASTAAFQPGPLMAVYYATKAYVLSFSEALGNEVSGTGVTVTALCPGPTTSGFQVVAAMEESKLVKGRKIMSAQAVAKIGYQATLRGKRVVIPGVLNKLMAQSVRFTPRNMVTAMVRSIQERASA